MHLPLCFAQLAPQQRLYEQPAAYAALAVGPKRACAPHWAELCKGKLYLNSQTHCPAKFSKADAKEVTFKRMYNCRHSVTLSRLYKGQTQRCRQREKQNLTCNLYPIG